MKTGDRKALTGAANEERLADPWLQARKAFVVATALWAVHRPNQET
jgi:hypothetical protein